METNCWEGLSLSTLSGVNWKRISVCTSTNAFRICSHIILQLSCCGTWLQLYWVVGFEVVISVAWETNVAFMFLKFFFHIIRWGPRCHGAVLQIGRSPVRSQLVSVDFFIDIKSFRSHYELWGRLSL